MVTIIWIRHGKKAYANSKGPDGCYQHDPPLKPKQNNIITSRAKELIDLYGYPDKCYTSPYARTRETANVLLSQIEDITPVYVLPDIGEYLGNQTTDNLKPCAHPDTLIHNPVECEETLENFNKRCHKHINLLGLPGLVRSNEIIWIVTHGFVMRTICGILEDYNIVRADPHFMNFDELGALVLTQDGINTNFEYNPHTYNKKNMNENKNLPPVGGMRDKNLKYGYVKIYKKDKMNI